MPVFLCVSFAHRGKNHDHNVQDCIRRYLCYCGTRRRRRRRHRRCRGEGGSGFEGLRGLGFIPYYPYVQN